MESRLHYLAHGERRYDIQPVRVYERPYWEFQAVLKGRIGLRDESGEPQYGENSLWILEAGLPHGWTSDRDRPAEVLVFHLDRPDPVLAGIVQKGGGCLKVPLDEPAKAWLLQQKESLFPDWKRETESTSTKVLHLLSGISLMVQEKLAYRPYPSNRDPDRERVEKALYWYRQSIGQNPSIGEAARVVGVSPVHLRRLFQRVLGESPKRAFQKLRLEQARLLLADPARTVEAVSEELDFSDASSLTRAYRAMYGVPPRRRSDLQREGGIVGPGEDHL